MSFFGSMKPLHAPRQNPRRDVVVAVPQDALAVLDVFRECFDEPTRTDANFVRRHIAAEHVLLARHGSAVLGYAVMFEVSDYARIRSLAVRPRCRREGVGSLLVHACTLRTRLPLRVTVPETEPVAVLNLLKKSGFVARFVRSEHPGQPHAYEFTRQPEADACEIGGGR